jgi:hypothetical protein
MQDINAVTMAELEQAIQESIDQLGGIDQALSACDRMYSATFISKPFPLGNLKNFERRVYSLFIDSAVTLFERATGTPAPVYDENDHEDAYGYNCEHYENMAEEWAAKHYPDLESSINAETLVVEFCNYKGEGGGTPALYCLNKHLPVFTCKADSFNAVN